MVTVKVRLQILSKEDLKDLEQDIVKLEQLADRKQRAQTRVGRKIGGKTPAIPPSKRGTGIFGGAEADGSLPSSIIKKRRKAAGDRRADSSLGSAGKAKASGELVSGAGAPAPRINAFKALQKEVSLNTKATSAMQKGMMNAGLMGGILRGGSGGLMNAGLGIASRVLPAAIAIQIGMTALQIWMDSYGAGGVNDPRKLVLNDVTSFVGLERETSILSGKQFFANSRTLKQGQEIQTNTMNMRDGFARTKLLRSSYGRS